MRLVKTYIREVIPEVFIDSPEKLYMEKGMDLPPYTMYLPLDYRDGPEGFISWCDDNVCIPIYSEGSEVAIWTSMNKLDNTINPDTQKSFLGFWNAQKEVVRECLRMKDGRFLYKLICFCWPRGDGKSLLACLIQLWKFFNWPKQTIVLAANSKDQIKFVHYDIMRDVILNSPKLLEIVGKKNVQEKHIRLTDKRGNIVSTIHALSSFSGIVSNITGYTFSEIFAMKTPKFFVELDGSIRTIPNALGVIDSTVSSKTHLLYHLFTSFVKKESRTVYFSYRCSKNGKQEDYWNPNMDDAQLNDYRIKFPFGEFERFFLNLWGSRADKIFTEDMIDGMAYIGCDGKTGNFKDMLELISKRNQAQEIMSDLVSQMGGRVLDKEFSLEQRIIAGGNSRLIPISNYYELKDGTIPCIASIDDLQKLGDLFDTDWCILVGIDRADPMKESLRGARTIVGCIAKGLLNSRGKFVYYDEGAVPNYIYVVLNLAVISNHSLEGIKDVILVCNSEYDGVDKVCGERWGIWDLKDWCNNEGIEFEAVYPDYGRQKAAFSELFITMSQGRLKCPPLALYGAKGTNDILREELESFYHDPDKHWFGSTEKRERYGVQDDVMFQLAWCIYGGREKGINDFKSKKGRIWFGTMSENREVLGMY